MGNVANRDFVLDGLTMIGAAEANPAVRVWDGKVRGVMLLNQGVVGAHAVLDHAGQPTGSYVGKSDTGFVLVAPAADPKSTNDARLTHDFDPHQPLSGLGGGSHALLFGVEGESTGRLAIDSDGSMHFGAGAGAPFDTSLTRQASVAVHWDPPELGVAVLNGQVNPNSTARLQVPLAAATAGDIASCAHSKLAGLVVQLSCVAVAGGVEALLVNVGAHAVDAPSGTLRAAVSKFAA